MRNLLSGIGQAIQAKAVQTTPVQGQMMSGKVVELMPDNRAIVQLGKQKVHAQLETPLTKGNAYLFQVEKTDPLLLLKAIKGTPVSSGRNDIQQLLKQLGVPLTKHNSLFLKEILQQNIPFQQAEVKKALALLEGAGDKPLARQILVQMFQKRFPIRSSIFQALATKQTTEFSSVLTQLQNQFNDEQKSVSNEKVRVLLSQMKGSGSSLSSADLAVQRITTEVSAGKDTSFQLFKQAGIVREEMSFTEFQQTWNQWAGKGEGVSAVSQTLPGTKGKSVQNPPFPQPLETISTQLKKLFDQQLPVTDKDLKTLSQWLQTSERVLQADLSSNLRNQWTSQYNELSRRRVFEKLTPFLSPQEKVILNDFVKRMADPVSKGSEFASGQLEKVIQMGRQIEGSQLPSEQKSALIDWMSRSSEFLSLKEKDMMLLKLKTVMDFSGFSDERRLSTSLQQGTNQAHESTLKTLLLQGLNDGTTPRPETAKQMLHLLNGIQLTSHVDQQHTLQMALQIPGDLLGSLHDIHMNLEGRKTQEGTIDPDFCHIIFYLDLANLKETVIDLNIVDRRIAITVFNNSPKMEWLAHQYKDSVREGLSDVGYELSSLVTRQTHERQTSSKTNKEEEREEGVDIRV
ncbi:hypothetical protein [Halobacillus litoralis]|uniref:hypothetical protein n=1 Tax=Halobacillus litoralis TaxID=45668 RepID=UPI002491E3A4|nr:hypothetical protein [Halobacillus litoralis]